MATPRILALVHLRPPQAWDAIIPQGPVLDHFGHFGPNGPHGPHGPHGHDEVALNTQPIPPGELFAVRVADVARHIAAAASTAESITEGAGAKLIFDEVEDWCPVGWPWRWPWPRPPKGDPDPPPHPEFDTAYAQFIGALVIGEIASRMVPSDLREAMVAGADRLLDSALSR